jgi:hypothetical protein
VLLGGLAKKNNVAVEQVEGDLHKILIEKAFPRIKK